MWLLHGYLSGYHMVIYVVVTWLFTWLLYGHLPSYVLIYLVIYLVINLVICLVITGLSTQLSHGCISYHTVTYLIITWLSHGYLHYHVDIYLVMWLSHAMVIAWSSTCGYCMVICLVMWLSTWLSQGYLPGITLLFILSQLHTGLSLGYHMVIYIITWLSTWLSYSVCTNWLLFYFGVMYFYECINTILNWTELNWICHAGKPVSCLRRMQPLSCT